MTLETIALKNRDFYAPGFKVVIDDKRLSADMSSAIMRVSMEEKVDEGAAFEIDFMDEFDRKTQRFKWLDHPLLQVGARVSIDMGYSGNLSSMILGKISVLEPSFFSREVPTLTIRGQDLSYDIMRRESPGEVFKNMTFSDIAKTIAGKAALRAVVETVTQKHEVVFKNNDESYFSFLLYLAAQIGFEISIQGKTMFFGKPGIAKEKILTLELGRDIISFNPTLETNRLYSEVEVRCHNVMDPAKPVVGSARAGSESTGGEGKQAGSQVAKKGVGPVKKVLTGLLVKTRAEAEAAAKAELNRADSTLVRGEVQCIGIPQIRAGVSIEMTKMGQRFSGKYYVDETVHAVDTNGYRTRFSVTRSAI